MFLVGGVLFAFLIRAFGWAGFAVYLLLTAIYGVLRFRADKTTFEAEE